MTRLSDSNPKTVNALTSLRDEGHGVDVQEVDPCVLNHVIFATLALKLQYCTHWGCANTVSEKVVS